VKDKIVTDFNEEHVIPEALGNKLLKIYDVCTKCNSLMGTKIDSELTNNVVSQMFRQINMILGKSGKIPNPFHSGRDEDGRVVFIDENYQPYLPPVERLDFDEKTGMLFVSGGDFDGIIKAINKKLARHNLQPLTTEKIEEMRGLMNTTYTQPKLNYSWSIDEYKLKLAFMKIAYEFGFLFFGHTYIEDDVAKELRNFIYDYIYNDIVCENIEDYVRFTGESYRQNMHDMAKTLCDVTKDQFYHMIMTQDSQDGKCVHIMIGKVLTHIVRFCSLHGLLATRHKAVIITYPSGFVIETN